MYGAVLRKGEVLAGAGAVALLVSLFLPWYGLGPVPAEVTGWGAFSVVDVILLATGLLGLAVPVTCLLHRTPAIPVGVALVACGVASLVTLLVLYRMIDQPGPDDLVEVRAGAWLGLAGVVAIVAGGWIAMADERMEVAEVPFVPARPAPAVQAPAGSTVAHGTVPEPAPPPGARDARPHG
jgi:hypothetical protein